MCGISVNGVRLQPKPQYVDRFKKKLPKSNFMQFRSAIIKFFTNGLRDMWKIISAFLQISLLTPPKLPARRVHRLIKVLIWYNIHKLISAFHVFDV